MFLNSKSEKPSFCRIVQLDSSVEFDFSVVLRSMRILYGSSCVVEFKCVS